ncbi:MAG TPA: hypothetical protein VKP08_22960 [Anaerolineales bacterium]|nr:hypothetical protein [Anaerolineales bacterium]
MQNSHTREAVVGPVIGMLTVIVAEGLTVTVTVEVAVTVMVGVEVACVVAVGEPC